VREFASARSRVAALSIPAKVLYTAYSVLSILGLLESLGLYNDIVRFGVRSTPQELFQNLIGYYQQMASRKLLETTHYHLFSIPVFLLIVGHLFLMTSVSQRTKLFWIGLGIAGTVLHMIAPWAVYGGGAALAWTYPMTGALLFVPLTVMSGFPIWEMWTSGAIARSERDGT
jgi:hypothetical protein